MSEKKVTAEGFLNNIANSLGEKAATAIQNSGLVKEEKKTDVGDQVSSQFNRLFGREKPVHNLLGGGKSADVMLWRDKKMSAGVLAGATAIWVLFQWLNYHFLSLICFGLVIFMISQFLWANASGYANGNKKSAPASKAPPRVVLPEELFVNIAKTVGVEVNRGLVFLQDVATKGTIKQFSAVVGSLLTAAIIGTWFNFLTVIYLGFIAAHTLPVVYEKYADEIDAFLNNLLSQLEEQCTKLDRTKVASGKSKGKKA